MTNRQQIRQLEERNHKLSWDNLQLRLEMEILIDGTESKAAKKILSKYRRKRDIRNEDSLATQN